MDRHSVFLNRFDAEGEVVLALDGRGDLTFETLCRKHSKNVFGDCHCGHIGVLECHSKLLILRVDQQHARVVGQTPKEALRVSGRHRAVDHEAEGSHLVGAINVSGVGSTHIPESGANADNEIRC